VASPRDHKLKEQQFLKIVDSKKVAQEDYPKKFVTTFGPLASQSMGLESKNLLLAIPVFAKRDCGFRYCRGLGECWGCNGLTKFLLVLNWYFSVQC